MRRALDAFVQLAGPAVLVVAVGVAGSFTSRATEIYFRNALVSVAVVVAIYVFVGNSGVLSFGQISFVAVGAFAAGVMTVPADVKPGVLPDAFSIIRDNSLGNIPSLVLAAVAGGVFALLVGLPLMRLSGLAAGIATFAVLEITHNVLREWTKIGPGAGLLSLVPETTDLRQAVVGALVVIAAAFAYQRSRLGRLLRATREDPAAAQAVGVSVHRQRLWAFVLSGTLAGLAGGLYVHMLGSLTADQLYLELTFVSLAMLVVGGMTSLLGAVVGALAISGLTSFLGEAEEGVTLGFTLDLPEGSGLIVVGALMALVLILRPAGITGGRELSFAWIRGHGAMRLHGQEPQVLRIAVVGCGAVGSLFAANLATLDDVEVWAFDLNSSHIDAIKKNGLQLTGAGELVSYPHATTDPRQLPACDFGIVATKAMHADAAISATAHAFAQTAPSPP